MQSIKVILTSPCLIILSFALSGFANADDWSQWRGPNRDGHANTFMAPKSWPDSLELVWKTPVPAGLSSPVVQGDKVFLLAREDDDEIVACYSLQSGKQLWKQSYRSTFVANPQAVRPDLFPKSMGKGPFATPLANGDKVYALGVDRTISCFNVDSGERLWHHQYLKVDLPEKLVYECAPCGCSEDSKKFNEPGTCTACGMTFGAIGLETSVRQGGNYYGAASSPIFHNGNVIIHVGNGEQSSIIALDGSSGSKRWQWDGPATSSSSPVIAEFNNSAQLVTLTRSSVVGLDAGSGKLLWSYPIESNAQIITPVIFQDQVLFATYRGPITAIRIQEKGSEWAAEKVWENKDLSPYMASPVLSGDRLYGLSYTQRGQYSCINAATGETVWTSEGRAATHAFLIDTGEQILTLSEDGKLSVLSKTASAYSVAKQYTLTQSPTWAHPALIGSQILMRDEDNLMLWKVE